MEGDIAFGESRNIHPEGKRQWQVPHFKLQQRRRMKTLNNIELALISIFVLIMFLLFWIKILSLNLEC